MPELEHPRPDDRRTGTESPEPVIETKRLALAELGPWDAAFVLELLNDPTWIAYIGDRGIRTVEAARDYILSGPMAMYAANGFGLWKVALREGGTPVGMCGLLKRDTLPDVDIGFAFLARHQRAGYGYEAAHGVLAHARDRIGLRRVAAITALESPGSIRLLEKLGFRFERLIRMPGRDEDTRYFGITL